jgi:hypothetical protein
MRQWRTLGGAVLVALAGLGTAGRAAAQDSHYWSNQYGTRAELLGGNVVGSINDLSCTYYNPGAMSLVDNPEFVVTTDAFQTESFRAQGELAGETKLTALETSKAPSMFAVRVGIEALGSKGIAFSAVTRHDFRVKLEGREIGSAGGAGGAGGVSTEYGTERKLFEQWFGTTFARRIERFGVGVSLFGVYRSQSGRTQTLTAIVGGGNGVSGIAVDDFRYWHMRLLAKVGVSWDWEDFTFGVTGTTPGLALFGSGSRLRTLSDTNVDDGSGGTTSLLASDYQGGLDVAYRSRASIALGGSWRVRGGTRLHATWEVFARADEYRVLETSPFTPQTGGPAVPMTVVDRGKSVWNVGLGIEHEVDEDLSFYGGVWTDHSFYEPAQVLQLASTTWDILHVTGGANFRFRQVRFTVGVGGAWGSDEVTPGTDSGGVATRSQPIEVRYVKLKGILGLSFEV